MKEIDRYEDIINKCNECDEFFEAVQLLIESSERLKLLIKFGNLDRVDSDYAHRTREKISEFIGKEY